MREYLPKKRKNGSDFLPVKAKGSALLHNPLLNKGSAFSKEERKLFGLEGLLPPHVSTLEEQVARCYSHFQKKSSNLGKYIELRALQDRNETLFYALVSRHLEEMLPIIYTPTVGEAVQLHSHIFRFARGLYVSPENVSQIRSMAKQILSRRIAMIVVTDNQGILGIGDQGVGGMSIPIGKLSLYTLCAGIHPSLCLPICLDVGTDNEALLNDPLYLGLKRKRLTGKNYTEFIERFAREIQHCYPHALVQWEDLSKQNAFTALDRYRDQMLSFNDDIQGTGAVAVAGLLNAVRLKGESLKDQRFCILGAGAGGMGVARQIVQTLMTQGLDSKSAHRCVFVLDRNGLIVTGRGSIEDYKRPFAMPPESSAGGSSLVDVIRHAKITVLLGLSGKSGAFSKEVVKAVLENTTRPIIFALSNPTASAEAYPKDLLEWTEGRVIVATGSPFPPVVWNGNPYEIGQGNNVFIFPGVGLGALAAKAEKITDAMFTRAATRLSELAPTSIYPSVLQLRTVTLEIAVAVFEQAIADGVAKRPARDLRTILQEWIWEPQYIPFIPAKKSS